MMNIENRLPIEDLKDRLMKHFEKDTPNRFLIPCQPDVYAGRRNGCYTFMIPGGKYQNFYEEFNSCILETGLEGNDPYLYFSCRELSEEFINFCLTNFIPKDKRDEITEDPAAWFEKVSSIFGNKLSSTATSDKIAELYVFWQMKRFGFRNVAFGGYKTKSLRDIQCEDFEVEVKSTLNHHAWEIHTNNEQIGAKRKNKTCYYVLCRLENADMLSGKKECFSLNSLKQELINYSGTGDIFAKLPKNTSLLDKTYVLRETKVFCVDKNFPSASLTGKTGGAVLKNYVLDLNPEVLEAQSLEDFLKKKKSEPEKKKSESAAGIWIHDVPKPQDSPVRPDVPKPQDPPVRPVQPPPCECASATGKFLIERFGEEIAHPHGDKACHFGLMLADGDGRRYLYLPFLKTDNLLEMTDELKLGATRTCKEKEVSSWDICTYDPIEQVDCKLGELAAKIRVTEEPDCRLAWVGNRPIWCLWYFEKSVEGPAFVSPKGAWLEYASEKTDLSNDKIAQPQIPENADLSNDKIAPITVNGIDLSYEKIVETFRYRHCDWVQIPGEAKQYVSGFAEALIYVVQYVYDKRPDELRSKMMKKHFTNIAPSREQMQREEGAALLVDIADDCVVNTKLCCEDHIRFMKNLLAIVDEDYPKNFQIHLDGSRRKSPKK